MSVYDTLFWLWFFVSIVFLLFFVSESYIQTLVFGFLIIGFGLLKISQEKRVLKVNRKLIEKLKSI